MNFLPSTLRNPLKSWRCWTLLLLCVASFFFAWGSLFFWIAFALLTLTDPVTSEQTQAPSPLAKLILPAFFLIWMVPVVFTIFGHFSPILPKVLVAVGFTVFICVGLVVQRQIAKRKDILENL
jgi:hypothetical protein